AQMEGFRKVLLHDLTAAQFADMYAQTIGYGLFSARMRHTKGTGRFTRQNAPYELPKTNPFLKKLFTTVAGPEMPESVVWAVDAMTELLDAADMGAVLRDFGKATKREDPVVHFYETFLAEYDPKMREMRGVYYTPEPVVSYIVRSVDAILKRDFGLADGLADATKVSVGERQVHKVQILDPATGTGTFLHSVIGQMHDGFKGNKGMWSGYVRDHLLPRVHGFELLMAPYAVAHMKLGARLAETGYDFAADERLGVYLTNALEEGYELENLPAFARWLGEEANAASRVKRDAPVMVVLGNPPYSGHSANTGKWIADLLRGYDSVAKKRTGNYFEVDGQPLGERNPKWLNDDYVKFIRLAQWRIETTGYGVLAFISNHGYLDNPTFRGMRQSLMATFDDLYLLDLHGNSKKKETAPDGSPDKNVFDIQQGVGIGIFVKRKGVKKGIATVRHADLWGDRDGKYHWLAEQDIISTRWKKLESASPTYLFIPQDDILRFEYESGWSIRDAMPINSVGIVTARDDLTMGFTEEEIWSRLHDFARLHEPNARAKYDLGNDSRDWKVSLAQEDVRKSGPDRKNLAPLLYRPFDVRHTYYTGHSRGFHCMPRTDVMSHMLAGENLGLITARSNKSQAADHFFCTSTIMETKCGERTTQSALFPLYLYASSETKKQGELSLLGDTGAARQPNLAPAFVEAFATKLGMSFVPDGKGTLRATFGPEDVFHYIYAIFHSPTYRSRYAPFLKIDFPRVPLTSDKALFKALVKLGEKLAGLHLMESTGPEQPNFPVEGDNVVEKVYYAEPGQGAPEGRVYINKTQYFAPVTPAAWNFHIGGYQVAQKWLKDRKDRTLTYDDLSHYARVVAALAATGPLMAEVDAHIDANGGWPLA
ncbi:MAG: N-6 DNA methylase, partial [Nitrospinae bacterium]|nr:N-6 DNA methylase [Nitrospinota bacterium]